MEECSEELRRDRLRNLCLTDLYFLLRYGLNRPDVESDWCFDRCREVQANPNGYLDLWAREHYKSTIITFALTIQDILNNPEITIGIFSHTRPIAKAFLKQIKREFEANEMLKSLFDDILYQNPQKESPKWSEDDGIIVKRKGNPKESTIEAWGLVDGQPVSKHFHGLVYDDVVTQASVTTPPMMEKTTGSWELSLSLGSDGGFERYVGTRYHFSDSYHTMIKRGSVKPRIYACTVDGTETGEPVLMSRELINKKRRDQGVYTFGTQMLLNPKGDSKQGFQEKWLRHYKNCDHDELNKYIIVDPANEKKKTSDYTAIWVIGLGPDGKYRALDMVRDRLSLTERWKVLLKLHRKYKPLAVGYEKYGKDSDIQHFKSEMERINYEFDIVALGGKTAKNDRIKRLVPVFENGNMLLPETHHRTNYEGKVEDLVSVFIEEEYKPFPIPHHDDMFDAMARIVDPDFPTEWPELDEWSDDEHYSSGSESSWLGM